MRIEVSQVIDRPAATVFDFYAHNHVKNHPRWDPMMELEIGTEGPIGVGSVIKRRNTHFGEPIEGTMEVTEFEENRAMSVVIREGGTETIGRIRCEPVGSDRTRLVISTDMPWMDDPAAATRLETMVQGSADNIKALIEAET